MSSQLKSKTKSQRSKFCSRKWRITKSSCSGRWGPCCVTCSRDACARFASQTWLNDVIVSFIHGLNVLSRAVVLRAGASRGCWWVKLCIVYKSLFTIILYFIFLRQNQKSGCFCNTGSFFFKDNCYQRKSYLRRTKIWKALNGTYLKNETQKNVNKVKLC